MTETRKPRLSTKEKKRRHLRRTLEREAKRHPWVPTWFRLGFPERKTRRVGRMRHA